MSVSRESILGVLAVALAGAYYAEATAIPQSLLADAVGADGVPRLLAFAMGAVGLALAARGVLRPAAPSEDDLPKDAHRRAAGLLAILVAYLVAVPWIGYPLAIAGLIAAVAAYAGARADLVLGFTAIGGAALFWLMFKALLGIPMPGGVLPWG